MYNSPFFEGSQTSVEVAIIEKLTSDLRQGSAPSRVTFPPPLEYAFRQSDQSDAIRLLRRYLLCVSVAILATFVADFFFTTWIRQPMWNLKVPALLVLCGLFALTFAEKFHRFQSTATLLTVITVTLFLLGSSGGAESYLRFFYAGSLGLWLVMCLACAHVMFWTGVVLLASVGMLANAYWVIYAGLQLPEIIVWDFMLGTSLVLGAAYLYESERVRRKHYLFSRQARLMQMPVGDLEASDERLRLLVALDAVTGVANRKSFERAFKSEWSRAMRKNYPISLLLVKVDRLDEIGKHSSQGNCNRILHEVAQILKGYARRPGDLVARYDHTMLAILLADTELKNAHFVAEKLRQAVMEAKIRRMPGLDVTVACRIGVASLMPKPSNFPADLTRLACQDLLE